MAKQSRRIRRAVEQDNDSTVVSMDHARRSRSKRHGNNEPLPTLEYRTPAQYHYGHCIDTSEIVFGMGPAGVGKSAIPAAKAAEMLLNGTISRIYVTRPMVGGDEEDMGALPGTLDEKAAPWFAPIRANLEKFLGRGAVECHMKNGNIVIAPFQFMRGATHEDCFIILDEAQNTTPRQMKLFLTRMGDNCHVVINGDEDQCDIKGTNGLTDAVKRLQNIEGIAFYTFTVKDIVRNPLVKKIIERYHPVKHKIVPDEDEHEEE
jgi:phosphate starvation-inducible PhoH-like protein